jgi:hypothetical protein
MTPNGFLIQDLTIEDPTVKQSAPCTRWRRKMGISDKSSSSEPLRVIDGKDTPRSHALLREGLFMKFLQIRKRIVNKSPFSLTNLRGSATI